MKLIISFALTFFPLFGGMSYGQGNKKDSTIHFVTPKITEQPDTVSPPMQNVGSVSDDDVVPPPQEPIPDSLQVREYVEQMPEFPGGQDALMRFLSKNIKYPNQEKDANIQGKVFASFVVEPNGNITHIEIIKK